MTTLREENNYLREEIERLHESKIRLIIATSQEIERLRRFIHLLSNALNGTSFTLKQVSEIELNLFNTNGYNNSYISTSTKNTDQKAPPNKPHKLRKIKKRYKNNQNNKPPNSNNRRRPSSTKVQTLLSINESEIVYPRRHSLSNIVQCFSSNYRNISYIIHQKVNSKDLMDISNRNSIADAGLKSLKSKEEEKQKRMSFHMHTVSLASQKGETPKNIVEDGFFFGSHHRIDEEHSEVDEELDVQQPTLKDRMNAYQSAQNKTQDKQQQRIEKIKEDRNMNDIKV